MMTRKEAIQILSTRDAHGVLCGYTSGVTKALDMAIEALKQSSDEMQLLNDGTLKVRVANVLDIKRIMVIDDNVIYDSYYPDRPKGEWKCMADCGVTECDQCGWNVEEYVGDYNYCPNCGAIMENKE